MAQALDDLAAGQVSVRQDHLSRRHASGLHDGCGEIVGITTSPDIHPGD